MGRSSRERGPARVDGKPWNAAGGRSGDGPRAREAVTVARRKPCPPAWVDTMRRRKAQEGQVDRRDTNHDSLVRTDSHEDEGPVDEEWRRAEHPRTTAGAPVDVPA